MNAPQGTQGEDFPTRPGPDRTRWALTGSQEACRPTLAQLSH